MKTKLIIIIFVIAVTGCKTIPDDYSYQDERGEFIFPEESLKDIDFDSIETALTKRYNNKYKMNIIEKNETHFIAKIYYYVPFSVPFPPFLIKYPIRYLLKIEKPGEYYNFVYSNYVILNVPGTLIINDQFSYKQIEDYFRKELFYILDSQ